MLIAALVVLALAGAPAEPVATAPEDTNAQSRVIVGVVADDVPFVDPSLASILGASFGGTHVVPELQQLEAGRDLLDRMEWAHAIAAPDVRAVYWIEPVDTQRHRLYLFDPRADQIWVRSLPQGSDPADVLDTLGAMVRSLTDGLPEGAPRGMDRVLPPREEPPKTDPLPVAPKPTPPQPRAHVMIAASYVGSSFDDEAPWLSGGGVDVDVELKRSAFVRVGIAALQPVTISSPRLDVWRAPIAIEGGYRFRRDKRVRPELGAALAIDPIVWTGKDDVARSGRTARVALAPMVGLTVRLWRGLGLHLWARADVWLHNLSLVVADGSGRTERLRPHPVAALVRAGIHFVF